ncbi:hypothetical protein [Rhodoplanes sp. Z2-YC6860]|uniref:hypothetical protein n=1 Tax=Rhodoplanes sp. Z2-YC6860 TaxID=674703 RepID=UPI00078C1313|nr:hypothetical protein [Rhodoplanes sp. Z2-YC6860]AMN43708.1 ubiquinone/menaquinone biosynthesis methyltransferase protein [Rhodoplanes sp. Z2-YC6860]
MDIAPAEQSAARRLVLAASDHVLDIGCGDSLATAGFEIVSERERRDVALADFARQQARTGAGPATLGVHTFMAARRPEMVHNMSESISAGRISPVELITRMVGPKLKRL